jgi:excisionase family DNA binding protein
MLQSPVQKLAFSIDETVQRTGLGKDAIYSAIREGSLKARKHGRRTLILEADLHDFLNGLPTAPASSA